MNINPHAAKWVKNPSENCFLQIGHLLQHALQCKIKPKVSWHEHLHSFGLFKSGIQLPIM